ncbi:MAG: phenylalanine--tRNA ligase subunit beta [Puniceicoccales bacterium]|jgi:phenylalanyl-tRNA synthetase beta chain|nr:phenylalanine--tRNA ligase subunit beta [Puniceicoccales bacterium]
MRISLSWLKRFVDLWDTPDGIAETFIKVGFEVKSVTRRGFAENDLVVVGKILNFMDHPNSDHLSVCQVDIGDGNIRQIVCGAKNFKQNDYVPVALPGVILPGNIRIKKSKLRGVESDGMMCSSRELGLGMDHAGLLILEKSWPLGTKIHEIFGDNDVVFELELTTNRGDALCHYGIARELAAWYDLPIRPIVVPQIEENFPPNNWGDDLTICVESENCEFYSAIVLKSIKVEKSADWIRRDLEAVGISVVNNIVDITNWVMLAYGQPLHAFDRRKIGHKIIIRQSKSGEKIATLDGKTHEVDGETLMICDEDHPLAIAGVIGGEATKITETTSEIVLESACFAADSVRKTSKKLAIATDSAHRYARHVDVAQTENFGKIAAQMLMDCCGAELAAPIKKTPKQLPSPTKKIELNPNFVRKILGFSIDDDAIAGLLERLQYTVNRSHLGPWVVESPSYRWEVTRPIDLVEECLRVYGVHKIPEVSVTAQVTDQESLASVRKRKLIAQFLANNGFNECYNYSLCCKSTEALAIVNPLLDDQTHLRISLIPGLVENFRYNLQNDNRYGKFFEFGHVVRKLGESFEELIAVAFLIPTESRDMHWDYFERPTFFNAKNLMRHIWNLASNEPFSPIKELKIFPFKEGYSARIGDLETKSVEAYIGFLGDEEVKIFKMPLIAGEIFVKVSLFEQENKDEKYKSFSYFPVAKRDISLIVGGNCPAQRVVDEIQLMAAEISKGIFSAVEIVIFDIYQGTNLPGNKKSLGLNLSFKNDQKTPSDKEIDQVFERLVMQIRQNSTFELRG